jgi:hypothetical protein
LLACAAYACVNYFRGTPYRRVRRLRDRAGLWRVLRLHRSVRRARRL